MKRIIFSLLALIAIFAIVAFRSFTSLTEFNGINRELAPDANGVYAIKTTNSLSRLMKIENGEITQLYEESRGGNGVRTELSDVLLDGETLYAVRQSVDSNSYNIVKRELVKFTLPLSLNAVGETIYTEEGVLNAFSDLTMSGGELAVTTLDADGSTAYVQKLVNKDGVWTAGTTLTNKASFDNRFFKASYINGKLYAISKNSDIIYFEGVNQRLLHKSEVNDAVFCIASCDGGIAFSDITSGSIYVKGFDSDELSTLSTKKMTSVTGLAMQSMSGFTALVAEDGQNALVVYTDGTEKVYASVSCGTPLLLLYSFIRSLLWFAVYAAIYLVVYGASKLYKKSRSVAVKAGVLALPVSLAVFAAVFVLCVTAAGEAIYTISAQTLVEKQEETAASIKKQNLTISNIGYFGTGPFYREAARNLTGTDKSLVNELYYLSGRTLFTAVSNTLPFAYPAREVCSDEVYSIINSGLGGSEAVTAVSSDGFEIYAAKLIVSDTDTIVLFSKLNINENRTAFLEKALFIAIVTAAAAAVVILLMFFVFYHVTAPLNSLKKNAPKVAGGECEAYVKKHSLDQLAFIGRELNRLNGDYRQAIIKGNAISRSYKRFIPTKLSELVGRDTEAEIEAGDNRRFMATIAVNALANRAEIRRKLRDEEMIAFANSYFSVQEERLGEYGGVLVSNDFGLSSSKWLFAESDNAITASANLIKQLDDVTVTAGIKASETVILHRTSVLCGVTGTESRVVPFVSFAEADFLSGLSGRLSEIGAKLIITKEQLDSAENTYTTRSIGYVSVPHTEKRLELFEVLDIFPAEIKQKRQENAAVFSKALELYYGGDYYMARNLFSTVLRTSGDDGIARWYVFACEKLMNASKEKAKSGLFEAEAAI